MHQLFQCKKMSHLQKQAWKHWTHFHQVIWLSFQCSKMSSTIQCIAWAACNFGATLNCKCHLLQWVSSLGCQCPKSHARNFHSKMHKQTANTHVHSMQSLALSAICKHNHTNCKAKMKHEHFAKEQKIHCSTQPMICTKRQVRNWKAQASNYDSTIHVMLQHDSLKNWLYQFEAACLHMMVHPNTKTKLQNLQSMTFVMFCQISIGIVICFVFQLAILLLWQCCCQFILQLSAELGHCLMQALQVSPLQCQKCLAVTIWRVSFWEDASARQQFEQFGAKLIKHFPKMQTQFF